MKNLIGFIVLAITSFTISVHSYAQQDPNNLFYVHGFTQSSSDMHPLGTEMKARFGWVEQPQYPSWPSFGTFPILPANGFTGYSILTNQALETAHPEGEYIGVGYSAGGLLTRSVVEKHKFENGFVQGTQVPNPPTFITGFVTINTPNAGIWMAHAGYRSQYIHNRIVNENRMLRGPISIGTIFTTVIFTIIDFTLQIASAVGQAIDGFVQDMSPGSNYYSFINGTNNQMWESVYTTRRVEAWSEVPFPRQPAYANLQNGQIDWGNRLREASRKSHEYDETANRINSGKKWWQFWKWATIAYNRMRAGDWSETARAMVDENRNWEINTAGGNPENHKKPGEPQNSDGFIGEWSQRGIPGVKSFVKSLGITITGWDGNNRTGVMNHGEAIGPLNYNTVEAAMVLAGAQ